MSIIFVAAANLVGLFRDTIYYTALVKSLYTYQVKPNEKEYKKYPKNDNRDEKNLKLP